MELEERGLGTGDEAVSGFIVSAWPFPLWSVTIDEPRMSADLAKLRSERAHTIAWMEDTEARREPPPAISRVKVETLSNAYARWERERDECVPGTTLDENSRIRVHSSEEIAQCFALPSYTRLKELFRDLSDEERSAGLALGMVCSGDGR